jgi:outer membrane protein OmpA-like peptidoglycan-associated protein
MQTALQCRAVSFLALVASLAVLSAAPTAAGAGRIDAQGFQPAPALGAGYLQTLSGRQLPAGIWELGLIANYGADPLVIRDTTGAAVAPLVAHLATADLLVAIGILDYLEVGADIPLVLYQDGGSFAPADAYGASGTGIGDIRLVPRVRLTPPPDGPGVAVSLALDLGLPTGDADRWRGGGLRVEPRVAVEYRFASGVGVAANVGYAFQDEARLLYVDMEHLFTWSVAVDVPFRVGGDMTLHALAEVDGAVSVRADELAAEEVPVEGLIGGRFSAGPFAVHLAAGAGLVRGVGSPEWRILAGLSIQAGSPRDEDGDGFVGAADRCPGEAEDYDLFADDDGCPDRDNDGDGVVDALDRCPGVPEGDDPARDGDGCPGVAPLPPEPGGDRPRVFEQTVDRIIYFESGSVIAGGETQETLRILARYLYDHPEITHVWIEGHADERGSERLNMELSERRALAVHGYLLEAGIAPERLTVAALGEQFPVVSGLTAARRALNRRVELRFAPLTDQPPAGARILPPTPTPTPTQDGPP